MLDSLRRGAASWLAKGLLFLLILSFAVWGVADVFRGYGQGTVATVGKSEISAEDFRQAYQFQLDDIRRRSGGRISAEQARQFGLDAQVLARLIGATAMDEHARQLGLGLSSGAVADIITTDPNFNGPDGKFNRVTFDMLLRQAGYDERRYLAVRQRDEVREHLTEALGNAIVVPDPMVELLFKYREEKRTASHVTIDAEKAVTVGAPDEAKLKETFEASKSQFVVPEYRRLAVLLLSVGDVKKSISIADADAKAAYEQGIAQFATPERRRVQQIAFKDAASAAAAKDAIAKGQSFLDAAKAANAAATDVELGMLAKTDFIDAKIAEAAFALSKDQVSDVVTGAFATVLLKVTEIEAGRQKPFEEVKAEIIDRLAGEKAADQIQTMHDRIDEQRAAGKPLKQIADDLKVKFVEIATVDRTGKTPDGKPALDGAPDSRLAQTIAASGFAGQVGLENEVVELPEGGYGWVDVLAVTPERPKAFEEVKAEVETLWREQERRRLVSELAAKLVERVNAGEAFEAIAKDAHGTIETAKSFRRFGAQPGLPEGAVSLVFTTARGRAASAPTADGKSRIVLKVEDIEVPAAPTKEDLERLRAETARQLQSDAVAEYVAALQDRLGVTINQVALRRATGADQSQ